MDNIILFRKLLAVCTKASSRFDVSLAKRQILALFALFTAVNFLSSCAVFWALQDEAQTTKSNEIVQSLTIGESRAAILSKIEPHQSKEWMKKYSDKNMDRVYQIDGKEFRVVFIRTKRSKTNEETTPLVFLGDKLQGRTELYLQLSAMSKRQELLNRFTPHEVELISRGQVAIGMSEAALIEIFNNQPDKCISMKLNTYSTSGSARAYEAFDSSRRNSQYIIRYELYVINGKLARFDID